MHHTDLTIILETATFVIALLNIFVVLFNWNNSRTNLKFYRTDFRHFYRNSSQQEHNYRNSVCLVFCKIMVANCSSMPCVINSIGLSVQGYPDTFYNSDVKIEDEYVLSCVIKPDNKECIVTQKLHKDKFIKIPIILPPYGYAEGVIVFPYGPEYFGHEVNATLSFRTSKKTYRQNIVLHHQTDMSEFQLY